MFIRIYFRRGPDGDTALIHASRRGHLLAVSQLLKSPFVKVNRRNDLESTPLIEAAFEGHVRVVDKLLRKFQVLGKRFARINRDSNYYS